MKSTTQNSRDPGDTRATEIAKRILVPLDGSRLAECVMPHAVALARIFDAEIVLVRVLEHTDDGSRTDSVSWRMGFAELKAYLSTTAAKLERLGLKVTTRLAQGRSAQEIVEAARESHSDLIAISSHGRSGRAPYHFGSTTQKVVETACLSVLVVRALHEHLEDDWGSLRYSRILAAIDGSPRSDWALSLARRMTERAGAELIVVQVVPIPEMARHFPAGEEEVELRRDMIARNRRAALENLVAVRRRFGVDRLNLRTRVEVSEQVAETIERVIDEEDASLLVLSAHGYGHTPAPLMSRQSFYGGVAEKLLHYGRRPTLVFQDLADDGAETGGVAHRHRA